MLWGKENVRHTTEKIIQNSAFLFCFAAWHGEKRPRKRARSDGQGKPEGAKGGNGPPETK